jgi:hypothetical protein
MGSASIEQERTMVPTVSRIKTSLLVVVVVLGCGDAAQAVTAAVRNACRADAHRLCESVILDPVKRHACMQAHKSELSKGCIDAVIMSRQHE